MTPQNIIQAFSRTNRLFDDGKQYGQIVTFQAHDKFKKAIDDALMLYFCGGDGNPIAEDWDDVKFRKLMIDEFREVLMSEIAPLID